MSDAAITQLCSTAVILAGMILGYLRLKLEAEKATKTAGRAVETSTANAVAIQGIKQDVAQVSEGQATLVVHTNSIKDQLVAAVKGQAEAEGREAGVKQEQERIATQFPPAKSAGPHSPGA